MIGTLRLGLALGCALAAGPAAAQTATNLTALRGLAAAAALGASPEGRAALAANQAVTAGIQTGALRPPALQPFPDQQALALKDCFITDGNATGLADGLGTSLARAYRARAAYSDYKTFTSVAPSVADLIGYTNNVARADSNAAKYVFANGTLDGKKPVSEAAASILSGPVQTDVFGRAYGRPAGSFGGDRFGNPRPFQTAPTLLAYRGEDYFGRSSHSLDWLRGPGQDIADSPSFPSGHTTYGYTQSMLLALLVPTRYQQMVTRGAEYGHSRIVVGAHYAMDVIGGRATALHALAHLLANDPAYVGQIRRNPAVIEKESAEAQPAVGIADYPAVLRAARADLEAYLREACGREVAACAADDTGRFADPAANAAFYAATQTYGLPAVHAATAGASEDVARLAPEAGHLLTAAFPELSLAEANDILTRTLGPGGGFLDDGSAFGLYARLDLYRAGGEAAALAASRRGPAPATR